MYIKNYSLAVALGGALIFGTTKPCTATANDTLVVSSVRTAGPYALTQPIMVDSINKDGKKFSVDTYLEKVRPLSNRLFPDTESATIQDGQALPRLEDANGMTYLQFTVDCEAYVKASLDIKKIKHQKLFLDGNAASAKDLKLEPGRHTLLVACLQKKEDKDTLSIRLTTTSGKATINAEGKRPWTLNEMTDGRAPWYSRVSPSGRYALMGYRNGFASGKREYETSLIDLKTGATLLPEASNYSWVKGSNDDVLYRLSDSDGKKALSLVEVPSMKKTLLANDLPAMSGMRLSPDFSYFIYTTNDQSSPRNKDFKLFAMPDDRLYDSQTHQFIHLYDIATGQSRTITFGKTSVSVSDISPDSRTLLLSINTHELNRFPFDRSSHFLYDIATGRIDTLVNETMGLSGASFSPDGKQLLVTGDATALNRIGSVLPADKYPNTYDKQMFVYDIASRQARPLTRDFNPSISQTYWSKADGRIYFTATDGFRVSFYSVDPNKGDIHRYNYPIDVISSFSMSENSDVVTIIGQGPTYSRRQIIASTHDKKESWRPLGDVDHDKVLADVALPEWHQWKFKASRGDSIDGFYFLPPNFDATKKYPMIVYYYGGCTPTPSILEMNYPLSIWAALGYVVYAVEPSGAIGYGQEFGSRHVATWGHESGDDVIEGTRAFCQAHPFVDDKRLACIGASYGGFMTNYVLTKTDMFRTAVSHAGISDITAYWGAGNWGHTYGQVAAADRYPWNDPDLYAGQSPLYNADKIHTPLLLTQGSLDSNVPANQAWQLYLALRILGRDVEFLQVQNEDHVVSDYARQKEWQKSIIAWWARWLKDDPTWWNDLYKPVK